MAGNNIYTRCGVNWLLPSNWCISLSSRGAPGLLPQRIRDSLLFWRYWQSSTILWVNKVSIVSSEHDLVGRRPIIQEKRRRNEIITDQRSQLPLKDSNSMEAFCFIMLTAKCFWKIEKVDLELYQGFQVKGQKTPLVVTPIKTHRALFRWCVVLGLKHGVQLHLRRVQVHFAS